MYKVVYYPRSEVQVDILNKDELSTVTVEIPEFWAVQYLTETTGHTVQKFNNLSGNIDAGCFLKPLKLTCTVYLKHDPITVFILHQINAAVIEFK